MKPKRRTGLPRIQPLRESYCDEATASAIRLELIWREGAIDRERSRVYIAA